MPQNVTSEWVNYTPDKAKQLLKKNTRNRRMRKGVIEAYARDMANGHWEPTGDTVKVSNTGVLLDGQHRLRAVVVAWEEMGYDRPVSMLTVRGLPERTQAVMDTGATRTAGDALQLEGFVGSTVIAASAKATMRLEAGTLFDHSPGSSRVTHSEILTWIQDHPTFATFIDDFNWRARRTRIPASAMLTALWVLWNIDEEAAEHFLNRLISLEGLPSGSPILALHKHVSDLKAKRSRLDQEEWIGMIFHAWNRWRSGVMTQFLRPPKGGFGNAANFPWPKELNREQS